MQKNSSGISLTALPATVSGVLGGLCTDLANALIEPSFNCIRRVLTASTKQIYFDNIVHIHTFKKKQVNFSI